MPGRRDASKSCELLRPLEHTVPSRAKTEKHRESSRLFVLKSEQEAFYCGSRSASGLAFILDLVRLEG
jgi:hypothetical protein